VTAPQTVAAVTGSTTTLICDAQGVPPPSVQWIFKEQVVGQESSLEVQSIDEEKSGTYICAVGNDVGSTTSDHIVW